MMSPRSSIFVQLVIALGNRVLAHVDLQPLARLHQVQEAGLAHAADGLDAAGDAHVRLVGQFFGGLRAVLGENLRNGVSEIEALAVGPEAERLDLGGAAQALFEQIVFERQTDSFSIAGATS